MGGIFSNEEPKQDLTKYVTSDQLTAKNYINKDINDLTNYYTQNYINTNYIKNDQLTAKNYINNDQLIAKNYITKDVNNLTNYQTKGNYLTYSDNDKNTFDLESDYMLFRDKNKNNIMKFDNNSINFYNNKINLNNDINIGDEDNYFNIKKEDECLVTRYYKNQKKQDQQSVTILRSLCNGNSNNIGSGNDTNYSIDEEQQKKRRIEEQQGKLVELELKNIIKNINYSIYTQEDDSKPYVDVSSTYKDPTWISNLDITDNNLSDLKDMIKNVKSYKISINFNIKNIKQYLNENIIKYPFIKNSALLFVFSGNGPDGSIFKVIDSNIINDDVNKQPFISSIGKIKDGVFSFYKNDEYTEPYIYKYSLTQNNNKFNCIYIFYDKLKTLDDYITFMLESYSEIKFYAVYPTLR
jgi:hypothetical protein